jgi:hypothetical protein
MSLAHQVMIDRSMSQRKMRYDHHHRFQLRVVRFITILIYTVLQ